MSNHPGYAEVKVESCTSAVPLVQSAIADKGYSSRENVLVEVMAANLYIIHAKVLAQVDMIEWYSKNDIRRFVGRREPLESKARDYLVVSHGGCADLLIDKAQIFDINPEKPCRDVKSFINGKEDNETDARLILDLPLMEYLPYQDELENMEIAKKLLQVP